MLEQSVRTLQMLQEVERGHDKRWKRQMALQTSTETSRKVCTLQALHKGTYGISYYSIKEDVTLLVGLRHVNNYIINNVSLLRNGLQRMQ